MQIKDVMTADARYMPPDSSLKLVAQKMLELNSGFVPISDAEGLKLAGVVTDRDIAVRAVAKGMDPESTEASEIMSEKVAFCFSGDAIEEASELMRNKGIYRLVVLDNPDNRNLCGIVSLGDILRHDQEEVAARTAKDISKQAA